MPLTPETLPRHELNGLPVRVVESNDAGREGLEGRVVVETTNTLSIEVCVPPEAERWRGGSEARSASDCSNGRSPREAAAERENGDSRAVMVPKSGSVFEFAITDDAAEDEKSSGTASELADAQPAAADDSSDDADRADGDAVGCRDDDPSRGRRRAAGEDVAYVTVDGSRLLSRPARRTETSGDSPWQ